MRITTRVSLVLKDKKFLEQDLAGDGISVEWTQSLGSNKALELLNSKSVDFGSTAGAAALIGKANGNPIKAIYVYSRPEWTASGRSQRLSHHESRRPQGKEGRGHARHGPTHIPPARSSRSRADRKRY
jgi:hypothetical protein